jgi:hypothetical protein
MLLAISERDRAFGPAMLVEEHAGHPQAFLIISKAGYPGISASLAGTMQAAVRTTAALMPGSTTELDAGILEEIAADAPSIEISREAALQSVADVMAAVKLQPSKGAARRCGPVPRLLDVF